MIPVFYILFATAYAYVTSDNGLTWSEKQKLTASDGAAGDQFGGPVAIYGDVIVSGANGVDDIYLDTGDRSFCCMEYATFACF